jgi:hypothetical protein
MKSYIFGDVTPCSPLEVNRRFEGICHLRFQGRRIRKVRNHREGSSLPASHPISLYFTCFLSSFISYSNTVNTESNSYFKKGAIKKGNKNLNS